jgi:hypothetical protein
MCDMKVLLVVWLAACGVDLGNKLTPTASPSAMSGWRDEVTLAIDIWRTWLGYDCEFPLSIGGGGSLVSLIPPSEWPGGERGLDGLFYPDVGDILIKDTGETSHINGLVHELGHAIGLGHSADPDSIMFPRQPPDGDSPKRPTSTDAQAARRAIGCPDYAAAAHP